MVGLNESRTLSSSFIDWVVGFFFNGADKSSARKKVSFGVFCYYGGEVGL